MKHAVATLEGALLDAAVCKGLGLEFSLDIEGAEGGCTAWVPSLSIGPAYAWHLCPHSTDWAIAGPLIESERIDIGHYGDHWTAQLRHLTNDCSTGPTPLIAAMRAYVCSRFGEEVELPSARNRSESLA